MAKLKRLVIALALSMASIAAGAQPAEDALVIDTRSPAEYAQGHVEGAVLIPYDGIEAGILKVTQDKDATIYLYCGSGGRAEIARKRLTQQGFKNVTNLGGIADAKNFLADEE